MKENLVKKINLLAMLLPIILLVANLINPFLIVGMLLFQLLVILINQKENRMNYLAKNVVNKSKINKNIIPIIAISTMVAYISCINSSYKFECIKSTSIIIISTIVYFLVYISDKNRIETYKKSMNVLYKIIIFMVVYAIIIRVFGNQYIEFIGDNAAVQKLNIGRLTFKQSACGDPKFDFMVGSITGNPNMLSLLCLFGFIIENFNDKKNKLIDHILMIIGVMISGSRMAQILFLVVIFTKKILSKNTNHRKVILCLIGLIGISVCCIGIFNIGEIFNKIDFNGRIAMWKLAIDEVTLLGKGLGGDGIIIKEQLGFTTSMHNSYLSILVNLGLMFTIVFITFNIITIFKKIFVVESSYEKIAFISLICLMMCGLTESVFFIYGALNYLYFYNLFIVYTNNEEE